MTLTLGVSRSESEIALSQEWGGWLTWNEKDVRHPFKTMILTSVTMVGWADVPDSDRGDFWRRRSVDISSCIVIPMPVYLALSWYMCSQFAELRDQSWVFDISIIVIARPQSTFIVDCLWSPGPRLNIKTVLSTYGDFHVKDKTAVRTSYL